MTRLLPLLLLLLAAPLSAQERRHPVTDFDRIIVEGPYEVRLTLGRRTSATTSGSAQDLEGVSIQATGQTLRIRRNPNAWTASTRPAGPVIVTLETRTLRSARLVGAGRLSIEGAGTRLARLDLNVEGSGRVDARAIAADRLAVGLMGSGGLTLAGRAGTMAADVQGSGRLDGSGLTTESLTLNAATSGEVMLTATREANVSAAGLGQVTVSGPAACTVQGPGAGSVRCGPGAR